MLAEIELDVLHFLDRAALEALQMHSRVLRDLVNLNARNFPLRQIRSVQIIGGAAWISQMHRPGGLGWDAEMLLHLVNNAFVHRLLLTFRQESLPLLHHLRSNANDLQCQIRTLYIDDEDPEIDYTLVGFLGAHMKPQIYGTTLFEHREDYVMLFAHNALRGHIKHFESELHGPPAPDCLLPELFGVDVIETCTMTTYVDPRPWIRRFTEVFETAERGTDIVRSVTLLHVFDHEPLRHILQPLARPRRTDVPAPHSDFVKNWLEVAEKYNLLDGTTTTESTVAELFVFENAKAAKKLEIFVWTIENSGAQAALHVAYLLQVVDI